MVRVCTEQQNGATSVTDIPQIQAAFAALSAIVSTAVAVTPMAVRGADFVNSVDGSRFQIIGVA
jgi:hypothetical protein